MHKLKSFYLKSCTERFSRSYAAHGRVYLAIIQCIVNLSEYGDISDYYNTLGYRMNLSPISRFKIIK